MTTKSAIETGGTVSPRASLRMTFSRFCLPPVQDALVIGKRAAVGSNAVARALEEITPGMFKLIRLEHPIIESILVRRSDLRKIAEERLIPIIVRNAEKIMDETDSLHLTLEITITVEEEIVK